MTVTSFPKPSNSLATFATPVCVYRYAFGYELLTNVNVVSIQFREGANPSIARFRYNPDGTDIADNSNYFDKAINSNASRSDWVRNDDRLVVMCFPSNTNGLLIFDGFAQVL